MNTFVTCQDKVAPPPIMVFDWGRQGGGRTPQEKERVKRKIESSADRAIDRLVYALSRKGMIYGLNEDEIKIVERE